MKRTWIAIGVLIIFLFVSVAIIVTLIPTDDVEEDTDDLTSIEGNVIMLTQTYPTEVVILGESPMISVDLEERFVAKLDKESLARSEGFRHSLILINEKNGGLGVTDEEWNYLKELLCSDASYNCVYIGTENLNRLCEMFKTTLPESSLSLGIVHETKDAADYMLVEGVYDVGDSDESLEYMILAEQAYNLRMLYGLK